MRRCLTLIWMVTLATGLAGQGDPRVGSRNTLTAGQGVARPAVRPEVVELYRNMTFDDFKARTFACPGVGPRPWAKVVLEMDFEVTAGRQYDRTCTLWVGGANLFYGTTAEPSKDLPQRWHAERDVTDYLALLTTPRPGRVELGTVVDATYNGVLHGSARLLCYPAAPGVPAATTPDLVLPLAGAEPGTVSLASGESRLAGTFRLPRNVVRACLEVTVKSEHKDEFWYTDLASGSAATFEANQAPAFREVEVYLDGRPAGVAPVFPLIFTGGMDPLLWRPIPGVQTLNFEPWRVDLTPFAGLLGDGEQHTVALGVWGAKDFFSAAATLLVHLDPGATKVPGAVTENTLSAAPVPGIKDQVAADGKGLRGEVSVASDRSYRLGGFVDTSRGRVTTEIVQDVRFRNVQKLEALGADQLQDILQTLEVLTTTRTSGAGGERVEVVRTEFPLRFKVRSANAPDKAATVAAEVRQTLAVQRSVSVDGFPADASFSRDEVVTHATGTFDAKGQRTGHSHVSSSQECVRAGSDGSRYRCRIESVDGAVTAIQGPEH